MVLESEPRLPAEWFVSLQGFAETRKALALWVSNRVFSEEYNVEGSG